MGGLDLTAKPQVPGPGLTTRADLARLLREIEASKQRMTTLRHRARRLRGAPLGARSDAGCCRLDDLAAIELAACTLLRAQAKALQRFLGGKPALQALKGLLRGKPK